MRRCFKFHSTIFVSFLVTVTEICVWMSQAWYFTHPAVLSCTHLERAEWGADRGAGSLDAPRPYERALCAPLLVSPVISRGAPRPATWETSISEGGKYGREMADQILPTACYFHSKCRDLLHAANLRHGTDGFTSSPKEVMLRIFSPEKSDGFSRGLNSRTYCSLLGLFLDQPLEQHCAAADVPNASTTKA